MRSHSPCLRIVVLERPLTPRTALLVYPALAALGAGISGLFHSWNAGALVGLVLAAFIAMILILHTAPH